VTDGERPGIVLQHGELGPPGVFGEWLRARGIPFELHETWRAPLPDLRDFAFVASLGAVESVRDARPAWVPAEVAAVRDAVAADVPVLGLCFGGQVLSAALDGGVDRLARTEIGWIGVEPAGHGVTEGPWLQWHDDILRIPSGAAPLARSPAGPAAFRLGRHLGVQFHPEATAEIVDRWAVADTALETRGVTREELAEQSARHAPRARRQAFRLFDDWWVQGPGAA
jgi:GMP synthase-like glutamine amidotransferase